MSNRTKILLLFNNSGREYVARIESAARRMCNSAGFNAAMDNAFESGASTADLLEDDTLAGVVLTPPYSDNRHALSLIEERNLPYVRIAPLLDMDRGCTVIMDEYDAARAITEHLLDKGHRRIAIMRGPDFQLVSMRRYNGYANALGARRLRVEQALVAQGDFSRESGREQAAKLFAARPTAIFASNDEMAAGIIDAANAARIAIPQQISLVGYDDNAVAKTTRPRLTTVRQPLELMGERAAKLLADRIRHPGGSLAHEIVPYEIVERESVAEFTPDRLTG
jgi:LacI family transcriptional regulator, galactose operon repressor